MLPEQEQLHGDLSSTLEITTFTHDKGGNMLEYLNALSPFAASINCITLLICLLIAKYFGVLQYF